MKCPKCGYNSFEFLDSCKKCSNDLASFKQSHGIRAVVLPFAGAAVTAAAAPIAAAAVAAVAAAPAVAGDSFTWDPPAPTEQIKPGDDIFPDLDLGFALPPAAEPTPEPFAFDLDQPTETPPASMAAPDEPELADFSFDEPAEAAPPSFDAPSTGEDSFASLLETGDSSDVTAAAPAAAPAAELESPWESPATAFGGQDDAAPAAATESSNGDFDLESFSWGDEEKKEPAPQPAGPQVELDAFSTNEFDSLFGEPDDANK